MLSADASSLSTSYKVVGFLLSQLLLFICTVAVERETHVSSFFPPKSVVAFPLYLGERENQWPTTSQNDLVLWGSREVA